MVKEQRFGRKNGKGFYDYPASGPKSLWPGLAKIVGKRLDPDTVSVKELKDRFLFTVALEAARCMAEGIVTDPREADVGSILGFGFAPYSGGALSFIDFMGPKAFVKRARELAEKYGRALRAEREARPDGRARRDVLRDLRREAEGGVSSFLARLKNRPAEGDFGGASLLRLTRLRGFVVGKAGLGFFLDV